MPSRQPRSAVRNAADRQQVKRAERAQQRIAERFLDCLRAVMATREGRLVFWTYLGRFGVYQDMFDENAVRMARNAGRQQAGNDIRADVLAAGEDLYQVMEQEMRAMAEAEAASEQAAQQAQTDEMTQ